MRSKRRPWIAAIPRVLPGQNPTTSTDGDLGQLIKHACRDQVGSAITGSIPAAWIDASPFGRRLLPRTCNPSPKAPAEQPAATAAADDQRPRHVAA